MSNNNLALMEQVVTKGDLSQLNPQDRVMYYKAVCESVGLNPLTKPFEFMVLQGKTTLYARKDATEQLRRIHGISVTIISREVVNDIYVVTARATDKNGRSDESIGAVNFGSLKGDAAANAIMKAETKAKRRVTLSIAGLGLLDEHETESIKGAQHVNFDMETGEIIEPKKESCILEGKLLSIFNDLALHHANGDMLSAHAIVSALTLAEKKEIANHFTPEMMGWVKKITQNPPNKVIHPEELKGMQYAKDAP